MHLLPEAAPCPHEFNCQPALPSRMVFKDLEISLDFACSFCLVLIRRAARVATDGLLRVVLGTVPA